MHVRTRHHDFADLDLRQFDGAENEFFLAGGEQPTLARLLDLDLQLLGRVRDAVRWRNGDPQSFHDGAGDAVEQTDKPAKGVEKPAKRHSHEQGHAFGA